VGLKNPAGPGGVLKSQTQFCALEHDLVGGFNMFNHLEKYESQWEGLSHVLWKIKNV